MSMQGAPIPECITTSGDNCQPIQIAVLCDDNGPFIRRFIVSCETGNILGFTDLELDGSTPYAPVGSVNDCSSATPAIRSEILCDAGNASFEFIRTQVLNDSGAPVSTLDTELDGTTPYVVVGPIENCGVSGGSVRTRTVCDTGAVPVVNFLRTELLDSGGNVIATVDTTGDGTTPYVAVGPIDFECCQDCVPDAYRQRRDQLAGVAAWVRPAGAYLVTVKCRAVGDALNPPTITDAAANVTPLFVGDEETWVTTDATPLTGAFTVTNNDAGDLVTIVWVEVV